MITPDNILYYSIILQLVDNKGDLEQLSPGVNHFVKTFYEEYKNHSEEKECKELFHYCDSIFNQNLKLH